MKKTLQAREYIEMSFGFDKEQISLAIPTDGMTLKSGWKITPLYNPMVNINHYLLDNEVSRCSLINACFSFVNRLGRQMLTTLNLVRQFQSVSYLFDGYTETNLMTVLSIRLT